MALQEQFDEAVENVKALKTQPKNEDLLEIYALYKQATVGNVDTARPGMLDLKGKAKWDAWNSKKDVTNDDAKRQYVTKVQSLIETIGLK